MSTAQRSRQAKTSKQGSGGAAPALLDTRGYLRPHRGKVAESREKNRGPHADAPLNRGPSEPREGAEGKWNPFSKTAWKFKRAAAAKLGDAYESTGRDLRAVDVRACGVPTPFYSPSGAPLAHPENEVPTAKRRSCGSRWCVMGCAATAKRKARETIIERLRELEARAATGAPLTPTVVHGAPTFVFGGPSGSVRTFARSASGVPCGSPFVVEHAAWQPVWQRRPRWVRVVTESTPTEIREMQLQDFREDVEDAELAREGWHVVERTPRVDRLRLVVGRRQRRPVAGAFCVSARAARFWIGPPKGWNGYGARFLTLTQNDRADEPLADALDRLEDALARLMRSQVWLAHVDGAVVRIEFELSTPKSRKRHARELRDAGDEDGARELETRKFGVWWHAHAHVLALGRYWPQSPPTSAVCARDCRCTRCLGVDDEDSLLLSWRRAMVETGRYGKELRAAGIDEPRLRRAIRRGTHAANQRPGRLSWSHALQHPPAIVKPPLATAPPSRVLIGGARIQAVQWAPHGKTLSRWGALCEVVKYTTKTATLATLPVERVAEVVDACARRRLLRCTGLLFGVQTFEDVDDEAETPARDEVEGAAEMPEHNVPEKFAVTPDGELVPEKQWVPRYDADAEEAWRASRERLHDKHARLKTARNTGPPEAHA